MRILIVEDEVCIAKIYAHLAMERGHTHIDFAGSGVEAIECAMNHTYELITLDVQVPGGGDELVISTLLRNMNPHAVIAVISGSLPGQLSPEVATCIDVGISKPVQTSQFSQLLEAAEKVQAAVDQVRLLGVTWQSLAAIREDRALSLASRSPDQELIR